MALIQYIPYFKGTSTTLLEFPFLKIYPSEFSLHIIITGKAKDWLDTVYIYNSYRVLGERSHLQM